MIFQIQMNIDLLELIGLELTIFLNAIKKQYKFEKVQDFRTFNKISELLTKFSKPK